MTTATRSRLAIGLCAVAALLTVATLALVTLTGATQAPSLTATFVAAAGTMLWAVVGAVIVVRTGNRLGWVFLAIGTMAVISFFGEEYVGASHRESSLASLPLTVWAGLAFDAGNAVAALLLPLVFLWFPTGRPPTPRWRWVERVWATGAGIASAWLLFRPGDVGGCLDPASCDVVYTSVNPIGLPLPDPILSLLLTVGTSAVLVSAALAIVSLVARFRRADALERQQLKWLLLVGTLMAIVFLTMFVTGLVTRSGGGASLDWMWVLLVLLVLVGIPVAATFAILRHGLYEIDVVISKTIVFAGLALAIGAAYVAIVVGVGQAIGAGTDSSALQIVATAAIALAFQPARSRLEAWGNRIVYGKRATPYEVMANFGSRVAAAPSADLVLSDMAEAAREGVGALAATVRLRVGDGAMTVTRPEGPTPDGVRYEAPVLHGGEPIGALQVVKPSNEPVRSSERILLDDLAGRAGLAFHNVRLRAELEARAEELATQTAELRRSRQRIVTARDAQRRRLERELREGVGAELAAIEGELLVDADLVVTEPVATVGSLNALGERANHALEELRDVARGIFPPLLADKGLAAAVESHVRKLGGDVTLEIDQALSTARLDPAIENAAYFCLVQASQNAARHAPDAHLSIRLAFDGARLTLAIVDDGYGFDVGSTDGGEGVTIMRDRIAALGGDLTIESAPGRGTSVTATLDVAPIAVAPVALAEGATP